MNHDVPSSSLSDNCLRGKDTGRGSGVSGIIVDIFVYLMYNVYAYIHNTAEVYYVKRT